MFSVQLKHAPVGKWENSLNFGILLGAFLKPIGYQYCTANSLEKFHFLVFF